MKTPTIATSTPMVEMISGKTRPVSPNAARPRISAATSVTAYDSNRSAAMPAQSPTLSPTLSAMVAALRGSSSGMPCSTLPTRSAPTSAALVKMPPPTRMNMASSAAPKPKPSSTVGASPRKISTTSAAPNRPRPTVRKPTTPPVRKAIFMAASRPPSRSRAAAATRRLARVASHMPAPPMNALNSAPTTKNAERPSFTRVSLPSVSCTGSRNSSTTAITTKIASVRNCRSRYADAPSCTAPEISCMFVVPLPAARTALVRAAAKTSATSAMTAAMTTYVTLAPVRDSAPPSAAKVPDIYVLLYRTTRAGSWRRTGRRLDADSQARANPPRRTSDELPFPLATGWDHLLTTRVL